MRRVTSILLTLSFVLVSVTGLVMALRPRHAPPPGFGAGSQMSAPPEAGEAAEPGEFQRPEGPGERRQPLFPKKLHELAGFVAILAGLIHIVLNWRPLLCHFGLRRRSGAAADACSPT
ncbi:DUF4405 domain-containing protein [bacterium]|nr:DUF4405 domain-containing protein [bacterium]